jgi:transcriptional regulator with PAS, ATPase and Fis domain
MQNLIQRISVRASTLLARERPLTSTGNVCPHSTTRGSVVATEAAKIAGEQIEVFNNLLQTVCRKLLEKTRELDCVSGELSNIMKVCTIPTICVDENLRVRSFTREIRQIFQLSREDIGRSLLDISCAINYGDLADDFQKVAETRKGVNRYLERRGCEVRYFMRMMPNFCHDNSFGGAVLIFSEVEGRDWGTA